MLFLVKMNRRRFSGVCLFGGLGFFSGLASVSLFENWRIRGLVPVFIGNVFEFDTGGLRIFPNHKVALLRRTNGVAIISLQCTHLGCTLKAVGQTLVCPCHGGVYTREGKVIGGPPPRDLDWFDGGITEDGMLYFYPGRTMTGKSLISLISR